jgi:hypothetical protein
VSNKNEIETSAVIVNTAQPQTVDDRKIAMSLKVSENLLRRKLEQDISAKKVELETAWNSYTEAKEEANSYARAYGRAELAKSGLISELMEQINMLLNLEGTETFTLETFMPEVHVGEYRSTYYSDAPTDDLLDDDDLLIVRPQVMLSILPPKKSRDEDDSVEQEPSYHVSIDSKLHDLIEAMKAAYEKWHTISEEKKQLEKKLKNVEKTVSDVETDLLVKQLREMDGGKETFQGVAAILNGYLNDEERPNLLEAPTDE